MANTAQPGTIYLVGAGPGSIDLLTLRAHALITSATCLLYDDLVGDAILALAPPTALVINVGKRCGTKTITQQQINDWIVQYAQQGHSVVRLKSGDPLLFGRAAEELEAIALANLPVEIVPGVSAGFAAAALARLPLTGRIRSARVIFATRHLAAGDTSGLAGIAPNASLVLYMPGKDYPAIARELAANGWPPTTHCILVSSLTAPTQQMHECALRELPAIPILPSPSLILFIASDRPPTSNASIHQSQ